MKKINTLLLFYGLLMILIVTEANAQNPETPQGSGTEQNPYQISKLNNLCWLSGNPGQWDKYYVQTADIDASQTSTWNVGDHDLDPSTPDEPMGFSPIGDDPEEGKRQLISFKGVYNGSGFVVLGLFINRPSADNIGMFGMIDHGAEISNLNLENINITGRNKTGGLVGYSRDTLTQVSHCNTSGTIKGNRFVGGLLGYNLYYPSISYCYSNAGVHGNSERIGGLVGYNYGGTIQHCFTTGSVVGKDYTGGLVGLNNEFSSINYCHALGPVTSTGNYCGGLSGGNINSTIDNSYAIGNINGGGDVGGLVGISSYNACIKNSHAKGDVYGTGKSLGGLVGSCSGIEPISHCYALGNVSGTKWYFGGLVGQCNDDSQIKHCYAKGNINPESDSRSYCGGLVGRILGGVIYKCFASGDVNNKNDTKDDSKYIGGLVGEAGKSAKVDLSCAKGDVYGYYFVGGLCGKLEGSAKIQNCYARGATNGDNSTSGVVGGAEGSTHVKYCYATGLITFSCSPYNGIVGEGFGMGDHSYFDKETTGISNSYYYGEPKTTAQMKKQSTYAGWGFGNYWEIDPDINDGYPYLIGTPQQIDGQVVWVGTSNSNWSNAPNWNFGFVPGMDDDVLIPVTDNNPVISADEQITVKKLTVDNNATLTLKSMAANTASLIVTSQALGNINMELYLEPNKYHFIHAPVGTNQTNMKDIKTKNGTDYLGLNPDDNNDVFERWNENETNTNNQWTDLLHGSPPLMDNTTFEMGSGYGYFNNNTSLSGEGNTIVFVSTIKTGSVSFNNSFTENGGEGYQVIGNPFTSTISINDFADPFDNFLKDNAGILHDNYEAVYLWKTDHITNDDSQDYEIICNCGFAGVGDSSGFAYDFIQPGQGFTVRIAHEGNIIFKPALRKHANSLFFKSERKSWPGVQLIAEHGSIKTSTKIGFNEYMTKWMDRSYDVVSLKGNNAANLYSRIINEHEHFAVQSLHSYADSVVCGIDIIRPGDYTFSIYQESMIEVDLKDSETGEIINMLNGGTYSIYLPEGNYENRFILYLTASQNTAIYNPSISKGKIYAFQKTIYLIDIIGLVEIYDVYGHLIKSVKSNGREQPIVMDKFADGVYIVKTATGSQKVFVR